MKKIRSYYLTEQAIKKVENKALQLTLTSHGKSAVIERMIDFACDNAEDFDAFFRYDPNTKKGGK
jgi:predicted TIM-barrel fold metal-dependent hydrolase